MKIPEQLIGSGIRLTKLRAKSKIPLEKGHLEKEYAVSEIKKHIVKGGNYGVLAGQGLLILDVDHPGVEERVRDKLPKTLTVKTPQKGRHRFYRCPDLQDAGTFELKKSKNNVGHVMLNGGYVVGPGSIHPETGTAYIVEDDQPIAVISKEQLYEAVLPWMKQDYPYSSEGQNSYGLSILDVLEAYDVHLERNNERLFGAHPVHGSSNGCNFSVSPELNAWHCFRCYSGGGPLQLIAVMEDLLECDESKKGALKGKEFAKVARIAEEKFDVKILRNNPSAEFGRFFLEAELEDFKSRIKELEPFTPHEELPSILEPLLEELAGFDEVQALPLLEIIRKHFDLKVKEIESYGKRLRSKQKSLIKTARIEKKLTASEAVVELGQLDEESVIHPAIDFRNNEMFFGVKIQGQLFIVSSRRKLHGLAGSSLEDIPFSLKHPDIDYSGFSHQGLEKFLKADKRVDPFVLLWDLKKYIERFVYFADYRYFDLIAVWIMASYLFPVFRHFPYLWLHADRGSGKTTLIDVIQTVCFNGQSLVNPTSAVLFREIDANRVTLLIDEFEYMTRQSKDLATGLLEILNAGYTCKGQVKRAEGLPKGGHVIRTFSAYSPKLVSGISKIDPVLQDRTISVRMLRKNADVHLDRYKATAELEDLQQRLRDDLYIWALQYASQVSKIYASSVIETEVLPNLTNRHLDLWEPLLSVVYAIDPDNAFDLRTPLQTLSSESLDAKLDEFGENNETVILLTALQQLLDSEVEHKTKDGKQVYRATDVMDFLNSEEHFGLDHFEQRELNSLLRKFHITVKQGRFGDERPVICALSGSQIENLMETFAVS
jgi:hypothetical protein